MQAVENPALTEIQSSPQSEKKAAPVKVHPVYTEYPQTISLDSVKKESIEGASSDITVKENEEFTQEQFASVWNDFAKAEKKQRPRLSDSLLSQVPSIPDRGLTFRFKVGSQTVKEFMYRSVHDSLEAYLRKNLHNSDINLRFETNDEVYEETGLPYTSKEKYKYFVEKNPALLLLRDAFDLETD